MFSDSIKTRYGTLAFAGLLLGAVVVGVGLGFAAALITGDEAGNGSVSYPTSPEASSELEPGRTGPRAALPRLSVAPGAELARPGLPANPGAPPGLTGETAPEMAALPPATRGTPEAPVPAWKRNAAKAALDPGVPMVGVVMDDLGLDHPRTRRAIALPAPVTMAFLPYGGRLSEETAAARAAGHELLVHVSMEPEGGGDPGPHALLVELGADEIRARLGWALTRFPGYVGINNHMGSRFTSDAAAMDVVMEELKARGLLFLDSRTAKGTVAHARARALGVPAASRQVFLDRELTREAVDAQLRELEALARAQGHAIAIGHPHDATLEALDAWIPTLRAKGLQLAPLSALMDRGPGLAAAEPPEPKPAPEPEPAPEPAKPREN